MAQRVEIIQNARDWINWDVPAADRTFSNKLINWVNRAQQWVAAECPEAVVPEEIRWTLPGTYSSGAGAAVNSYISTTADPFVLEFTSSAGSTWTPETNGVWNGLMWLEITLPGGTLWRGQCREFWTELAVNVTHRYVTVDRPVTFPMVDLQYRLAANYLWFRDDVQRVDIGQRFGSNGNPLVMSAIDSAIVHDQWSNQNSRQWGYPGTLRREQQYQQPAPNLAPTVTLNTAEQAAWGPEPWGTFEYCFTYIWGYREEERKTPSGSFYPLFESAPSPVSDQVIVVSALNTVTVGLPDIAWELNYGDVATTRYGKSGWKKRIYRRRATTTGGTHASIEHPNVFQFLVDVEDTATSYLDNGSVIPDYTLRIPEIGGYFAWSMWPLPNTEQGMEYQLRVYRRPGDLLNDYDAPRIAPQCTEAITYKLVSLIANHDKQPDLAVMWEKRAEGVISEYRKLAANPSGSVQREGWDGFSRGAGWPRAKLSTP